MDWNVYYWHILGGKGNVVLKNMLSALIQMGVQILALLAGKIGEVYLISLSSDIYIKQ